MPVWLGYVCVPRWRKRYSAVAIMRIGPSGGANTAVPLGGELATEGKCSGWGCHKQTPEFVVVYGSWAGVDVTHSQALRVCGQRWFWHCGHTKTHTCRSI